MYYKLSKSSNLSGDVKIPGSKSGTARGLVIGTLADGVSHIQNPMPGIDSYSIVDCCRLLGAKINTENENEWIIEGVGGYKNLKIPANILNVGNSGTGYYFLTTMAAMMEGKSVISGDYQICYRPIAPLLKAIRQMGGTAISTRENELAPLMVQGPLTGGKTVEMPGENVQWSIGLMVCAPLLEEDTVIKFHNLGERPYAALTMDWMKAAGVEIINHDYEEFIIPGGQTYHAFTKKAPSDWCGASYPMVAAAITPGSKIRLLDMDINDFQGERHYVDWIRQMGGHVEVLNDGKDGVIVEGGHELHGIEIDCTHTPDAVPALAVLGSYAQGKTVLKNITACRMKETDRCKTIVEELTKMGGKFIEHEDSLEIFHSELHGATLNGHHDHRIVMASSCAALMAEGETIIDSAEHVGVSFPRFYEVMKGMGANITRLIEE